MSTQSTSFVRDANGERKYLNLAERRAFLDAAMSAPPEVATFCAVLAYTGARVSEILALSPDRIDFDDEIIVIESLKKRRRGHFRTIPVPRELLRTLDAVHNIQADQRRHRCANRMLWPWCRTTAWSRVKEIMRAAGVSGPMASPKGLRHSLGVSAIQSGIPLNMVQKWLGHTHMHTTAIYTNALGPEEREFADQLWQAFRNVSQSSLPSTLEERAMKKNVIETLYGKRHKFEIVRTEGSLLDSTKFSIYRDGDYYKGSYSSLIDAVDAARREG